MATRLLKQLSPQTRQSRVSICAKSLRCLSILAKRNDINVSIGETVHQFCPYQHLVPRRPERLSFGKAPTRLLHHECHGIYHPNWSLTTGSSPSSLLLASPCRFPSKDILGNISFTRHAGHSKWANIRHIKAAKDGEKANKASQMANRIKIAIREGNGADPRFNVQLARILEQASKADVPKSTIENVIKNAIKAKEEGSIVIFEGKGPGNFMLVIETFTNSPKKTVLDINHCYKKFGGQSCEKVAAAFFDRKGVILVKPAGSLSSFDEVEEAAIMAEAEEVQEDLDEDGNTIFKVICDQDTVYSVRKQMAADHPDVPLDNATFQYIPKAHSMATLSGPILDAAIKMVTAMERVPGVERVYTNIEVTEDQS